MGWILSPRIEESKESSLRQTQPGSNPYERDARWAEFLANEDQGDPDDPDRRYPVKEPIRIAIPSG
jgi:hypothetical protein